MKREIITIGENGKVHIPTAPVLDAACEIASFVRRILRQGKQPHQVYLQRGLAQGRMR